MHFFRSVRNIHQVFHKGFRVVSIKGAAVLQHGTGRDCLVVNLVKRLPGQITLGNAAVGTKPGKHFPVFPFFHSQLHGHPLAQFLGFVAGCIGRGQPLCQQGDGCIHITGFPAVCGSQVLFQLSADHFHHLLLGRGLVQAKKVVPTTIFGNESHILPGGFRPLEGHMSKQGPEHFPLAHTFPDIPDMEQQLHGQITVLDVGQLNHPNHISRIAVTHTAGHGEQIQTGITGASVGQGTVKGSGVIGLFF